MAARIATSTITHAQQILHLDRGRITKTGTHTERLGLGRRTPICTACTTHRKHPKP